MHDQNSGSFAVSRHFFAPVSLATLVRCQLISEPRELTKRAAVFRFNPNRSSATSAAVSYVKTSSRSIVVPGSASMDAAYSCSVGTRTTGPRALGIPSAMSGNINMVVH